MSWRMPSGKLKLDCLVPSWMRSRTASAARLFPIMELTAGGPVTGLVAMMRWPQLKASLTQLSILLPLPYCFCQPSCNSPWVLSALLVLSACA
ncbi:hypothetical protein D0T12_21630 [Actinomadura spongiicola]|uniref:Uncharacterized protein n=1 Tax=Actinomadura spongiicola TaxID=2303421 RepID=A0A372GEX2_9ACTN|nr:hypothetical protein D0T12_21630 [Actinomadura spongiicola]